MTKLLLSPGQPIVEARRQLRRTRIPNPPPTGDATTATSTAWAATATASATPHTKGSWTELVSATTADTYGLIVGITNTVSAAGTDTSILLDVGVGAAASETVRLSNLAMGWRFTGGTFLLTPCYRLPVFIPAGSRIAVRSQSTVVSKQCPLLVTPLSRAFSPTRPSTTVTDLGTNTATSAGVALSVPGGNNTKGAWTEIIAATTEPYTALAIGLQGGADTTLTSTNHLLDIGVGASAAEVVAVENVHVSTNSSEVVSMIDIGPWAIDVPAGSRIAVRYAMAASGSTLDAIVYGIR